MTLPLWPSELPQRFQQSGYSESFPDRRFRSQTDVGPGKSRLRSYNQPSQVAGQLVLRVWEKSRLERFVQEELSGGNDYFLVPDQTRDGRPLRSDDGTPVLNIDGSALIGTFYWVAKFGQLPVYSAASGGGDNYSCRFSLEVLTI